MLLLVLELHGWIWCGFFLRVCVLCSGVLCLRRGFFFGFEWDAGWVMKGRVWSVGESENFEFLEEEFSCFGLEDDEGAQFGSSSSSLGLNDKEQRALPFPLP